MGTGLCNNEHVELRCIMLKFPHMYLSAVTLPDVLRRCETLPPMLREEHKIDDVKEQMAEEDL